MLHLYLKHTAAAHNVQGIVLLVNTPLSRTSLMDWLVPYSNEVLYIGLGVMKWTVIYVKRINYRMSVISEFHIEYILLAF